MAVYYCSAYFCDRMISVSVIPGGNPVARANPGSFAGQHMICGDCKRRFCYQCVRANARRFDAALCSRCLGTLTDPADWPEVRDRAAPAELDLVERGNELARSGRDSEALAAFTAAIELRPRYIDAHFYQGLMLNDLGRPDEAVAAYRQVLGIDPGHLGTLLNLGRLCMRRGQLDEALAVCEQTLRAEPNFVLGHLDRAVVLHLMHRLDEALAACARGMEIERAGTGVGSLPDRTNQATGQSVKAAILLDLGRHAEALAAVDAAIAGGGATSIDHQNRVEILEALGRGE
ncbi:tetratricopeptide repeat protein [Frankia sp. CNm7]|uniref:tetratricopeptide repeat protein n=1 Tax=Frankia nepalensis TaxID=1836974 RepID=UPI001931DDC0|nr:tetratricopeptide repeat protein [Frankia nepalensis]MBL7520314.1 tetratricopeptide repeat protein [Frankia nepalensis]